MDHQHARRASRLGTAAVTGVAVAAGILFATSAGVSEGTNLRNDSSDLPGLVRGEAARLSELEAEVAALRGEVRDLTAAVDDAQVQQLRTRADELAEDAHLVAVEGPGLEVVLDDAPTDVPVPDGIGPDDLVVHQQDLQAVVNALWGAGAEAMTLMDQRVVSTSAVRCVGSTLRLQGQVYSPPYVVRAIGDPGALQDALDASPQVAVYREYVRAVGLGYDVSRRDSISMPGFEGALDLQHAHVAYAAPGDD
ncbi:DUF881 domain-containing protein [Thalassiella azotivora]